jgi:outer membrane protein TolC
VTDPMLAPPAVPATQIASWDEGLRLVRTRSPKYLAGVQRLRQAEARSRIALAGMLPQLNGQGSFTHEFFTDEATVAGRQVEAPLNDVFGVSATLRQPILDLRALRGIGTGELNERAAQLSLVEERRQIALDVVEAMLSSLAAARVAELNRKGLQAALERLALASARQQYGRGTLLDVDRAQQDVAAARADLIAGDESLQQTREALGLLLGSDNAIGVDGALDLAAFERAVAQTCKLTRDVEQRPDVASARARVQVAERLIDDAELRYLPTLDLVSELRHETKVTVGPKTTWDVQGVLTVPLYDGGARYAVTREQRALAEQARQQLIDTRLSALLAIARATRAVAVTEAARDVAHTQRELAASIDQRIRQGYAGGLGTSLDLVTSAQSLRQAENRLALLELEVAKARAGAVLARAECMY